MLWQDFYNTQTSSKISHDSESNNAEGNRDSVLPAFLLGYSQQPVEVMLDSDGVMRDRFVNQLLERVQSEHNNDHIREFNFSLGSRLYTINSISRKSEIGAFAAENNQGIIITNNLIDLEINDPILTVVNGVYIIAQYLTITFQKMLFYCQMFLF